MITIAALVVSLVALVVAAIALLTTRKDSAVSPSEDSPTQSPAPQTTNNDVGFVDTTTANGLSVRVNRDAL